MRPFTLLAGMLAAVVCICIAGMAPAPAHPPQPHDPPATHHGPGVDVALLLDTSNSMDGLINQAKSQLWAIVQQFAHARKHGRPPVLRVALFEYGNTNLPATEGYIRQVVPLTDDLDRISQALFALTTRGGDEYCGQVIDEAITRLDWSAEPGSYKAIFIAGNEPFTQGEVDYRSACERAVNQGIIVNTIHCGPRELGIQGMWHDGARLGRGQFFNIDQDRHRPHIHCPQDPRLAELSTALNETYLWFGRAQERQERRANQLAQDSNAAGAGVAAERAAVKGGAGYRNVGRDLVDSYAAEPQILEALKDEELPEPMQRMTLAQRKAHVEAMARQRAEIQAEIGRLSAEREAYLSAELRKMADGGAKTLGEAVVEAVQAQLAEAGYEVKE